MGFPFMNEKKSFQGHADFMIAKRGKKQETIDSFLWNGHGYKTKTKPKRGRYSCYLSFFVTNVNDNNPLLSATKAW